MLVNTRHQFIDNDDHCDNCGVPRLCDPSDPRYTRCFSRVQTKLETFMQICKDISGLSHDTKYKVATIIITDDFREICSIGYNGDYRGGPNDRTNFEHGNSGFLHSEENALFHLSRPFDSRNSLILLCTHKPCTMCAKRIVNSNIKRVVYCHEYSDDANQTDNIFEASGVRCHGYDDLIADPVALRNYVVFR